MKSSNTARKSPVAPVPSNAAFVHQPTTPSLASGGRPNGQNFNSATSNWYPNSATSARQPSVAAVPPFSSTKAPTTSHKVSTPFTNQTARSPSWSHLPSAAGALSSATPFARNQNQTTQPATVDSFEAKLAFIRAQREALKIKAQKHVMPV